MNVPVRAAADLRLLRAAVFAAVCVVLSAIGHGVASGRPVGLQAVAAGWLAVMCVVVPLAGRRRSLRGITAGLTVGQAGLHLMFCLAQCAAAGPAAAASGSPDLRVAAARLLCGAPPGALSARSAARIVRQAGIDPAAAVTHAGNPPMAGMAGMPGMASSGAHGMSMDLMLTPGMVAGHLAAALVLGLLLWRGEAALWKLAGASRRTADPALVALRAAVSAVSLVLAALVVVAGLADCARRAAKAGHQRTPARPTPVAIRHCVVRRGPPRWGLAA